MSLKDPAWALIVERWPHLPEQIKAAVLQLIQVRDRVDPMEE